MEHTAHRPSWDCRACGKPWPCPTARTEMQATMDDVQLRMFLWTTAEEAAGHLPAMPMSEFAERFISWPRHEPGE